MQQKINNSKQAYFDLTGLIRRTKHITNKTGMIYYCTILYKKYKNKQLCIHMQSNNI